MNAHQRRTQRRQNQGYYKRMMEKWEKQFIRLVKQHPALLSIPDFEASARVSAQQLLQGKAL